MPVRMPSPALLGGHAPREDLALPLPYDALAYSSRTPSEVFKQRERLFAASMDVPLVSKIVFGLRKKGVDVPSDIVDKEGLVEL